MAGYLLVPDIEPGHAATGFPGAIVDLGVVGFAVDLTSSGIVIGSYQDLDPTAQTGGFVWTERDGFENLGTLPGGRGSDPNGINARAMIVGSALDAARIERAVVWIDGVASVLPDIGGDLTRALAVNPSGHIVGTGGASGSRILFWPTLTQVFDLGPGVGTAINAGDVITGMISDENGHTHAFRLQPSLGLEVLPDVPGTTDACEGQAINAASAVVGWCDGFPFEEAGTGTHAALWTPDGQAFDLNTVLDQGTGWLLDIAYGINEAGLIVATGTYQGQAHGALLMPQPHRRSPSIPRAK
jgi:uncharacterized membrane protein